MARIALAEIPGVNQVTAPIMTSYQEYKTPKANYAGVANALQQDQLSERAFSAPGQAMEQAGYAVSKVSGVFGELAGRLQDGQNYADIAKAESVMEQARAEHAMEAAQLPADERIKLWETTYRPRVDKEIGGMGLSAYSRQRVDPQWATFDAKTRTNIAYDAYKDKAEENKGILLGTSERKFLAGDFDGSNAALNEARDANLISEQEFQNRLIENERRLRDNEIAAKMEADPEGFIQEVKDGKVPATEIEKQRFVAQAKQKKNIKKSEANDMLDDMLIAGQVPNREFIQKFGADNGMSQREILSHINVFEKVEENTPEGQARAMKARSEILTEIEKYDPTLDTELTKYGEIGMMIRGLPDGLKEDMRDELRQKKKSGLAPDNEVDKGIFESIDKIGSGGAFGSRKKHPDDELDDPALSVSISRKEANLKSEFKKWRKSHPKDTIEQAFEWLNGMVKPDVIKSIKVKQNFPNTNPPASIPLPWSPVSGYYPQIQ